MKTKNNKEDKRSGTPIAINILGLLLVFLLYSALNRDPGYGFVFRMLKGNYETIAEYRRASLDDRYMMKLGESYQIFKFIASNTPPNAVIYLPGASAFGDKSNGIEFKGGASRKGWAVRFLYPRKVVLESEYDTSIYTKEITHVAIINGVGAEKLPYPLNPVPPFGVVPINNFEQINSGGSQIDSTKI